MTDNKDDPYLPPGTGPTWTYFEQPYPYPGWIEPIYPSPLRYNGPAYSYTTTTAPHDRCEHCYCIKVKIQPPRTLPHRRCCKCPDERAI